MFCCQTQHLATAQNCCGVRALEVRSVLRTARHPHITWPGGRLRRPLRSLAGGRRLRFLGALEALGTGLNGEPYVGQPALVWKQSLLAERADGLSCFGDGKVCDGTFLCLKEAPLEAPDTQVTGIAGFRVQHVFPNQWRCSPFF